MEFVSNCARGVPLEARAKIRRSSSFYCRQSAKQFEKRRFGKREKPEVGISYRKEKTADFVGCAQGHFLLWSEDVGKREFSGKVRAATNVAATRLI
jgi:hypothetical protein